LGWASCSSSIQHPLGGGLETNDDDGDVEGILKRILVLLLLIVALASNIFSAIVGRKAEEQLLHPPLASLMVDGDTSTPPE
jgi:hypothetical protein